MDTKEFDQVVNDRITTIRNVLANKAKEYARGDRLSNFKRAAKFMEKEPESVCWGFAMKHFTSLADIVDDIELDEAIELPREMVEEKLGDAINYLILLEAIILDRYENQDLAFASQAKSIRRTAR